MSVLEVHDVSIRYLTGDFKDIGLKEYVMRRLTKNYRVNEFWADKNIAFSLEKGEMLGIIGSNGAGKSTLLKVITGIMEPTEGWVKREGNVAALLELASGFDGDLTVKENTYLRGAMLGYTRKFMDETYNQIIEFAELQDFQDRPFKQLSSGMKSRLAFAIASMVQPDILILDEVLSVGDGAFRRKSEDKMKEIINGGATTILVSHSLSQVQELCTKVLWLERGEQIAFGDTSILCSLYQQYLDKTITLTQAKEKWAALNEHYDYLVVGSGLFGNVFAHEMAAKGQKCLVIDARQQAGGNAACVTMNGITVHGFGPHIFHTNNKAVWDYVNRFVRFLSYDGGFSDKFQGIPVRGYNDLIERLLKGIPNVMGMSYQKLIAVFPDISDRVLYTGGIDDFFEYCLGHLEYDSRRYELEELKQENFQDQAIVEVEGDPEGCVRIVEYKHFLKEQSRTTVIAKEYSQEWIPGRMRCFPVGGKKNEKLLRQYQEMAKEYLNIIFGGRLGSYKGYTMAEAIAAALGLAAKELEQAQFKEKLVKDYKTELNTEGR